MSSTPNQQPSKPRVFIGSSSEGAHVARALQAELQGAVPCEATIWSQGVFEPSGYTLDSLIDAARRSDFAVLVATPDDVVQVRDEMHSAARDNVVLELGLFVGALGRERTFVLVDVAAQLKLPSDLAGLTWVPFGAREDHNWRAAVGPAAFQIGGAMTGLGVRPNVSSSVNSRASVDHRELETEIGRITRSALAQGWKVKTNSDTTLRLQSPRGRTLTFPIKAPTTAREELRAFAAELRAAGLRVNQSVRRPVSESPAARR